MVVMLKGTINGQDITLTRAQGDRWEAIVPASLDGAFVVDLTAIDEAGNVGYTAKYIITIDLASLCVHIEPCPYYYLNTRTDTDPCLFASVRIPHKRLSKAGIERTLKKLGESANVANVHPHRYRRTLATNLLDRGANIQDVAAVLGHADLKTTQVYCYISQSNVRASYNKYSV